jgi:hypothetical protein
MSTPALDALDDGILNARILIQTEKTVGTEIDDAMAADGHAALGINVFHHQILEMTVWKALGEVLDETDESVLPHRLVQQLHRQIGHAFWLSVPRESAAVVYGRIGSNFRFVPDQIKKPLPGKGQLAASPRRG